MDQNYADLINHLKSIIDRHVHSKNSKSKFSSPWFNAQLKRMCKKKQRLFSRAKRTRKPSHWECYKAHKRDTLKKSGKQDGHILMTSWTLASLIITLSPSGDIYAPSARTISEWLHSKKMVGCFLMGPKRWIFWVDSLPLFSPGTLVELRPDCMAPTILPLNHWPLTNTVWRNYSRA